MAKYWTLSKKQRAELGTFGSCSLKNPICYINMVILERAVVYFDQQMGALHSIGLSKAYFFLLFSVLKCVLNKIKKKGGIKNKE